MATEIQVKAKRNIFKSDGWKRFSKNKLALIGLIIITLLILMAVFAPLIVKHSPYISLEMRTASS